MRIFETKSKDKLYKHSKGIVIIFSGKRNIVSTSIMNGGYREDIISVFNKDENLGPGIACKLRAKTYREHLDLIAVELGLNPKYTSGISTAASMENLAIVTEMYRDIEVSAFVTGGIEVNGGRVGDKATYDERLNGLEHKEGTINILLHLDAKISPGILTRALVTCTEAKTAALQELMADSRYSNGLATGSGTDGTIVIGNLESNIILTNAGKHSVFGEVIGRVVKKAVKEALEKQSGLNSKLQQSILRRSRRFGITETYLWQKYKNDKIEKYDFLDILHQVDKDKNLLSLSTGYFHIVDEYNWKLLDYDSALFGCSEIINSINKYFIIKTNNEKSSINEKIDFVVLFADMLLEIVNSKEFSNK